MPDKFAAHTQSLISPYTDSFVVATSDVADLEQTTKGVVCESAGILSVVTAEGRTTTVPVAAGIPFPIRVNRIRTTGTTVVGLIAALV